MAQPTLVLSPNVQHRLDELFQLENSGPKNVSLSNLMKMKKLLSCPNVATQQEILKMSNHLLQDDRNVRVLYSSELLTLVIQLMKVPNTNTEIQRQCIIFLHEIARKDAASHPLIINQGAFNGLVSMLNSGDQTVILPSLQTLSRLTTNEATSNVLESSELLQPLMRLLSSSSAEIQDTAARVLFSHVSKNVRNQREFAQKGGIQTIVKMLIPSKPSLPALVLLCNLVIDEENRKVAQKANVTKLTLQIINNTLQPHEILVMALNLLNNLTCYSASADSRQELSKLAIPEIHNRMVELLTTCKEEQVLCSVLSVLVNIFTEASCRQVFRDVKGVSPLLSIVSSAQFPFKVKQLALSVITNLLQDGDVRREIIALGGVKEVLNGLSSKSDEIVAITLGAVANFALSDDSLEMLQQEILRGGRLARVTELLQSQNATHRINSLWAIGNMMMNEELQEPFRQLGGVKLVISQTASSDIEIQRKALTALFNLSIYYDEIRRHIAENDGLRSLLPFVSQTQTSPELQRTALLCVVNLSITDENNEYFLKTGYIPPLLKFFTESTHTCESQELASMTLENLSLKARASQEIFRHQGLVAVMKSFSNCKSPTLQTRYSNLLASLARHPNIRREFQQNGGTQLLEKTIASTKDPSVKTSASVALNNMSLPCNTEGSETRDFSSSIVPQITTIPKQTSSDYYEMNDDEDDDAEYFDVEYLEYLKKFGIDDRDEDYDSSFDGEEEEDRGINVAEFTATDDADALHEAQKILNSEDSLISRFRKKFTKSKGTVTLRSGELPPEQITSDGSLRKWAVKYDQSKRYSLDDIERKYKRDNKAETSNRPVITVAKPEEITPNHGNTSNNGNPPLQIGSRIRSQTSANNIASRWPPQHQGSRASESDAKNLKPSPSVNSGPSDLTPGITYSKGVNGRSVLLSVKAPEGQQSGSTSKIEKQANSKTSKLGGPPVNNRSQGLTCSPSKTGQSHIESDPNLAKIHQKRTYIAMELLQTEATYVKNLHIIIKKFYNPLYAVAHSEKPFITLEQISRIFSCIDIIFSYNLLLCDELNHRMRHWSPRQLIGDVFLRMIHFLKVYTTYVNNYDTALEVLGSAMKANPRFELFLKKVSHLPECNKLTLESFLIMPVQRLPRYSLLLRDLLRYTDESHSDYKNLCVALEKIDDINKYLNQSKSDSEHRRMLIELNNSLHKGPIKSLLKPNRRHIREGDVNIFARSGQGNKRTGKLILFNDALLTALQSPPLAIFSKPYRLVQLIPLLSLGVAKLESNKMEITDRDCELTTTLGFASESIRDNWFSDLQSQIKVLRDNTSSKTLTRIKKK